MKKIFIILFLNCIGFLGIAQEVLIPNKTIVELEKERQLCSKLDLHNYKKSRIIIDSLVKSNFDNYDDFLNIAYRTFHDSIYESNLYNLVQKLLFETDEESKAILSLEIGEYGYDAIVALDKIKSDSQSFNYWKQIIQVLVNGYDIFPSNPTLERHIYRQSDNSNSIKSLNTQYSNIIKAILPNVAELSKNESYKRKLHDISLSAIRKGKLNSGFKYSFVQAVLANEVKTKDEELLNDYISIIDQIDESDAKFIIGVIGSNRFQFFPNFLVKMLDNRNENILIQSLNMGLSSWDETLPINVEDKVRSLFLSTTNDSLKYVSSIFLYTNYLDSTACNFLLKEIDTKSFRDKKYLIEKFGNVKPNNEMSIEMNKVLSKYLESENDLLFKATIFTYSKYKGKNVIRTLIPYISHQNLDVANSVTLNLQRCKDKRIVIEELEEYLKLNPNATKQIEFRKQLKN